MAISPTLQLNFLFFGVKIKVLARHFWQNKRSSLKNIKRQQKWILTHLN